jgi:hypothetical protein
VAGREAGVENITCVYEYTDASSSVVKRMQRKADSSLPSTAEFGVISTIQYSFRARCMDRGIIRRSKCRVC